ncbi:MAG: hypothetical protein ACXVWF_02320 [Actinomycetota bacterium]
MRRTLIGFAILVAVVAVFTLVRRSTSPTVTATASADGTWRAATACRALPPIPRYREPCSSGDGSVAFVLHVGNDADVRMRIDACTVQALDASGAHLGDPVQVPVQLSYGVPYVGPFPDPHTSFSFRWVDPGVAPGDVSRFTATCAATPYAGPLPV